jgi:hypothetical protein
MSSEFCVIDLQWYQLLHSSNIVAAPILARSHRDVLSYTHDH